MDVYTALHTRRSIRAYEQRPVDEKDMHALLDAAMIAPSAGNSRPWHFVVLDDPAVLARIPAIHPYAGMAARAPAAVLVCGDLKAEKYPGFWVQDCSAAIQNLLLAATARGIGTVWTGIHPLEDRVAAFRELCALPGHIVPLGLVVLGYAALENKPLSRFEAEKVHKNTW